MRKRRYHFQLFGGLYFIIDGKEILLSKELGKQLSSLFAYFLCNHAQPVPKDKIIETFWADSENPNNALKFAIFRLRTSLKKISEMPDVEYIVTARNGYQWNPELLIDLDTEQFEKSVLEATEANQEQVYQDAMDMYRGEFMKGSEDSWILADRGYYRSIYIQVCHTLAEKYLEKNAKSAIDVAEKGLKADSLDEALIHVYLKALAVEKRYSYAKKYFNDVRGKYRSVVGVPLEAETDFEKLLQEQDAGDVSEKKQNRGASFVGPLVLSADEFQLICVYEARRNERYGHQMYLLRFDLNEEIIQELYDVLRLTLRKTDVMTKESENTICLLIHLRKASDAEALLTRVRERLNEKMSRFPGNLQYSLQQLR